MPGIAGFYGRPPTQGSEYLIQQMARALEPSDEHHVSVYTQEKLALARISQGIVNPEPQPMWDDRQEVCVVMEGELYDTSDLRSRLANRGHHIRTKSDAELVLHLYLEVGDLFPAQLNGNFVLAIFDKRENKIIIVNDRLGLYPLFYAKTSQRFLFASGVRSLMVDNSLRRRVDRIAIAELLTFDHVLGDRTLLDDVKLMPQATIMTVSEDSVVFTPYASLRYPREYQPRLRSEYVEEFNHLMRQAVHRQAQDDLPKAVLLSGGMDSRVIAAILNQEPGKWPFFTFTWGVPGCDDARVAAEVAALTRARHMFFELKPDYLFNTAERAVQITDGMANIANMHALANLDQQVQYAQVIFKGFLGDAMFGYAQQPLHWAEYDQRNAIRAHLMVHNDQGVITFHPDIHSQVFNESFLQIIGPAVMEEYRDGMFASGSQLLADQRLYFDLTQRVPRMTLRGVDVVRSKAQVRLPYADADLLEFSMKMLPGYRYERRLVMDAFQLAYPQMSKIPLSSTGLPLQANVRDLMIRARRLLQWHLHQRGLSRSAEPVWKPYTDLGSWLRGVMKPWAEDILLNPRSLERDYYQPEFLENVLAKHMAGEDQTVRIGALISVELWHRLFLD